MKTQQNESLTVIERIHKELPYLNPALRRVAEYVLENQQLCKTITIKDLAIACDVAESSVTRFVKEIGLQRYQELKIGLAEVLSSNDAPEIPQQESFVYEDISRDDTDHVIIEKIVHHTIQTLNDTSQGLSVVELNKAVKAIEKANTIVFCCMGSSSIAAEDGVMRFTRAGKKCLLFRDHSLQLMTSAIVDEHDVVIGLSNSGRSLPVVESLKLANARGAQTIGITSFEDSSLAQYANVLLLTSTVSSPLGPGLYRESMPSKSAQILVMDVLYASFAARNFDETLAFLEETHAAAIRDTRA